MSKKTEAAGATVTTAQCSAAVLLAVQESHKEGYRGAFLTPTEARKVAAELIDAADAADETNSPENREKARKAFKELTGREAPE